MSRKSAGFIIALCVLCSGTSVFSDTIAMKTGRIIKGVIVEDYVDRIVISTYEGEVYLKKDEIMSMYYDSEAQNFAKLGQMALDRGNYNTAYAYFDKAFQLDPKLDQAKDGKIYVQSLLFRKGEDKKMADIKRREEFETKRIPVVEERKKIEKRQDLKNELGLKLQKTETSPQVLDIVPGSPAYKAGVQEGDFVVAIWGRLTGYMEMNQIYDLLVEKAPKERRITIERTVRADVNTDRGFIPNSNKLIGASLDMLLDGLTITDIKEGGEAAKAGLKKNDLIVEIDGIPTRYMPLDVAVESIHKTRRGSVTFIIRRDINLW